MNGVYLLHFEPRFHHAGHYLGYADDIGRRIYEHEMGTSCARLTVAATKAGSQLHCVRIWPKMDRKFERSLKGRGATGKAHRGSLARLCPVCKGKMLVPLAVRIARSDINLAENFGSTIFDTAGCTRDETAEVQTQSDPGNVSGQSAMDTNTTTRNLTE